MNKEVNTMLSQKVQELELQNRRLKTLIEKNIQAGIPKPKNCENCEHFMQYYWRDDYGTFHKIYAGRCVCGVPIKIRKGKKNPSPEDMCLCYEERN